MGLSKKLRETVEEIVFKYVGWRLDEHRDRITLLEDDVIRLRKKVDGPLVSRLPPTDHQPAAGIEQEGDEPKPDPRVEMRTTPALSKIAAFMTSEGIYNCHGLSPDATAVVAIRAMKDMLGTPEHESVHSRLRRLREMLLESHDEEDLRGAGVVDAAIAYIRSLEEEDEENEAAAKTWSPTQLPGLMPRACDQSDKLPNEIRVRLRRGDKRIDLTMLVKRPREGLHESVLAEAVALVPMPVVGMQSLNIIAPADVPTALSNRLFEPMVEYVHSATDKERAAILCGNCVSFEADLFDLEKADWLPTRVFVTFGSRRFLHQGTQYGDGINYRELLEGYGEHAASVCLIGQSFLTAMFHRLEEEAAPGSPDAPPAAPQTP